MRHPGDDLVRLDSSSIQVSIRFGAVDCQSRCVVVRCKWWFGPGIGSRVRVRVCIRERTSLLVVGWTENLCYVEDLTRLNAQPAVYVYVP